MPDPPVPMVTVLEVPIVVEDALVAYIWPLEPAVIAHVVIWAFSPVL